ncbi:hypothetical protein FCL40_08670 [Ferrimonas sediminicola]|uniref:Uncharacterized protein n=1 Tax=Ferrimonas sediminicola TaxID=2569538 RepID=A0A4U1BED2_9GAMM|nr:hypothetical protein [Ferrimonas sediminicola]TKB49396.1 hypothetical protein FCL40_08670 [Ferrimonas sediminicola]
MIIFKLVSLWLLMALGAVLNGGVRQRWLSTALGEVRAQRVSGAVLMSWVALVICGLLPWLALASVAQALLVGAAWLLMTLLFELAMNRGELGALRRQLTPGGSDLMWLVLLETLLLPPMWVLSLSG